MAKETSTDVATVDGGAIEVSGATLDEIESALATGSEIELRIPDPEEAARSILLRILEAKTDEEAFTPTGTTNGRALIGVPLEIHPPLRAFPSQLEGEGPTFFVVFEATRLDTGDRVAISTSARNVLAALINGIRRNRFPERTMKFMEAPRPTRAGFTPLWLVKSDYDEVAS